MAPKICISSPLEAGTSLLDSHNLSAAITDALDYVSSRLIRKRLHLTLILTQDDVALPLASAAPSPCIPQSPMSPLSPVANFFRRKPPSPIQELPTPISATSWPASPLSPRSPMTPGGLFSHPPTFASSRNSRNRSQPTTPRIPPSPRQLPSPRQPPSPFLRPDYNLSQRSNSSCSSDSSTSTTSGGSAASQKCSFKLIPAIALSQKDTQTLRESLIKASNKHSVTLELVNTSEMLIHRSLQQNRLIHSSEGLTVLALDKIYTLKLAIARYTYLSNSALPASPPITTSIHEALAEAVDELRLAIWSQQGKGINKAVLLRSYDHLCITLQALRDINHAYVAITASPFPILGIEAPSPPPLTSAPPSGPLPLPNTTRTPRRWHTTKDAAASASPMLHVMRKCKPEKNRTAQLWLDSSPVAAPQTHLQNARQRLHRPALPRLNTAERRGLAEVATPIATQVVTPFSQPSVTEEEQGVRLPGRGPGTGTGTARCKDEICTTPLHNNDDDEGVQIRDLLAAVHVIPPSSSTSSVPAPSHTPHPHPQTPAHPHKSTTNKPPLPKLNTAISIPKSRLSGASLLPPTTNSETDPIKRLHSFRTGRRSDRDRDGAGGGGAKTPGGWDDCTPVTRNEWSFFLGERGPRRGGVETC